MRKLTIKMSFSGEKIEGQGVGSATKEQINLIQTQCSDTFDVLINKHGKYDILHVHTVDPISFIRMMMTRKPVVMHVHFLPETLSGSITLPKFMLAIFKWYFLTMYRQADAIVVVNPIFIEPLTHYHIKKENIHYIPNFVSEETFFAVDSKKQIAIRQKYGIHANSFVVLGVGQVQTRKGVHDFIEVAKSLPKITFVWAGDFTFGAISDGYKELKDLVDHPPENVRFIGLIPREEMNDIYNSADVLFMPSYNELFPMAILEACNAQKPLLLRNLDLYTNILFGHYFSGSKNEEFVKIIQRLSEEDDYYQKGVVHSQNISQFYSRKKIRQQWITFYQNRIKES